eukprot:TRINITY_DN1386_c0_g1_i1.p1 TRINITY_DN1386_c0_g1~~TRINITY_DN1386_c0_g1_i1.p1  ORF type:complete len:356 (+),score=99.17 TRINITY_DN1386_c0_g1_i1:225-1292(+)
MLANVRIISKDNCAQTCENAVKNWIRGATRITGMVPARNTPKTSRKTVVIQEAVIQEVMQEAIREHAVNAKTVRVKVNVAPRARTMCMERMDGVLAMRGMEHAKTMPPKRVQVLLLGSAIAVQMNQMKQFVLAALYGVMIIMRRHRFAVDKDQCSNDLPVYNYTTYNEEHRSDILYTLRFDAYSSDNDGNYTDQWVLTVSDMKLFENDTVTEIVAAVCDQEELKQCTKHERDIKYQDAAKYLRDYLMPQALEVRDVDCSTIMAVNDANRLNGTSVALFVIGVIIVLLVIAVLLYFCVYRSKHKHRKNEKELKAIRDDDGCDEAVNDMEQTIVVRNGSNNIDRKRQSINSKLKNLI